MAIYRHRLLRLDPSPLVSLYGKVICIPLVTQEIPKSTKLHPLFFYNTTLYKFVTDH